MSTGAQTYTTIDDLYSDHAGRVLGVVKGRVPAADVDDVAQDVWLRASRYFGRRVVNAGWLSTIIRSAISDYYRQAPKAATLPLSGFAKLPEPFVDRRDVADIVIARLRLEHTNAVLKSLTRPQREAAAVYLRGDRPSPAQRQRMHTVRRALRKEVD